MAEDAVSHPSKPKSPTDLSSKNINPIKPHSNKFLYKAAIVTLFLVLLPLFPSIAPQFINQTLHARSWELLQLILVGIAVSYGLFSQKNDELTEKDNTNTNTNTNTNAINNNNAQSIVSKLLQVSSVFDDDESEIHTTLIEENIKVNSQQYYREQPVVVIAQPHQTPVVGKGGACEFTQKPLLLPVRSLKQPSHERDDDSGDVAVLRSPIPWRSRSGESSSDISSDPPPVSEPDQAKNGEDDDVAPPPPPPLPPRKQAMLSKSNSAFAVSVSPEKKVLRRNVTSVPKEESLFEKVLMMENDKEDEDEDDVIDDDNNSVDDVGRDVDKKADEFIAKFREQIRQQRIESIRKSTAQRAGKMTTGRL